MTFDGGIKFVVLASPRSGSTWLIDVLDSLEDVTAYGELFLPRKRVWDAGATDYPRLIETEPKGLSVRPLSVFSYLDDLYHKAGAVCFKLLYPQLRTYPEILPYLCKHHIRVVHLVRQNVLDVMVSLEMARASGLWHLRQGQHERDAVRIHLNPGVLIGQMKRQRRRIMIARKVLQWCRLPYLEVLYEDLLRDRSHFSLLWDFLSVNPEGHVPQSNLVKIRKAGHVDVISNYAEVKEALAGSAFAELID